MERNVLEYRTTRWSLSSGSPKARPGDGWVTSHDGVADVPHTGNGTVLILICISL
jgi:hypothetical protein